jgi:hypothetical protein
MTTLAYTAYTTGFVAATSDDGQYAYYSTRDELEHGATEHAYDTTGRWLQAFECTDEGVAVHLTGGEFADGDYGWGFGEDTANALIDALGGTI